MPKRKKAESLSLRFFRSATFFYCFFSLDLSLEPPAEAEPPADAERDCLSPDADGLLAPLAALPDVGPDALPVAAEPGFLLPEHD
jgi:hypothetical protein